VAANPLFAGCECDILRWCQGRSRRRASCRSCSRTSSQLAICLASVEAKSDDPKSAFEYVALAIRNLQDSGNTTTVSSPLAVLSALLDRLGDHEPAATIAGFALNPFTAAAVPELIAAIANLREVLGEQRYETLAAVGEQMSNAEMAAYACERIDRARAEEPSPTQH